MKKKYAGELVSLQAPQKQFLKFEAALGSLQAPLNDFLKFHIGNFTFLIHEKGEFYYKRPEKFTFYI